MDDLAENVDDLICVVDKVVGSQMDTILVLLVGWVMFGAVIFLVSHLIYSTLNTEAGSPSSSLSSSIPSLSVSPPCDIPPVLGQDQHSVKYIQEVLQFLISSGESFRQDILSIWREKLTHYAKLHSQEEGILVSFTEIDVASLQIHLENITVENVQMDKLDMQSDVKLSVQMKLKHMVENKPRRRSGSSGRGSLTDWDLAVEDLSGRLRITFGTLDQSITTKFEGWPDLILNLTSCNPDFMNAQVDALGQVIRNIASKALRCTQLDLRSDTLKNFPNYKKSVFQSNAQNNSLSNKGGSKPFSREVTGIGQNSCIKQMGVKVVKATNIGAKEEKVQAYVVIEVDEPSQRFQTRTLEGSNCVWDQHFSVNLTKYSSEILFEIWDQSKKAEKFLGLGIVSISELMSTPSQRHVIPLQGRPYEEDQVSGLLTIEFVFKDSGLNKASWTNGVMPGVHRTFETSENRDSSINKKTIYTRQEQISVPGIISGKKVAEMALKDIMLNKNMNNGSQPSKSTLLMHQVRTVISPKVLKNREKLGGETSSPTDITDDASESVGDVSITSKDSVECLRPASPRLYFSEKVEFVPEVENYQKYSRGRKHKRNLISSFRRSFKGPRSLSSHGVGVNGDQDDNHLSPCVRIRSASENRGADLNLCGGGGRGVLSNNEDGSSLSDVSAISNVSNKTYYTEESSLVLEVYERGRLHHYLIPVQAAKQGKFQKRGTKLHIYMDHIFTAQHIKLGTVCHVCSRLIPLRLGKQAYVCRDCGVTCHKQCHTRVESHCPRTSLDKMELYRGSFIVKMQKSRFLFRRNKKFSSGSISDHKQSRSSSTRGPASVSDTGSGRKRGTPLQSVSLDTGKSRLNILRKNIFRRKHRTAKSK